MWNIKKSKNRHPISQGSSVMVRGETRAGQTIGDRRQEGETSIVTECSCTTNTKITLNAVAVKANKNGEGRNFLFRILSTGQS